MNYLFSGEDSLLKSKIPVHYQSYIATAINTAPLVLACISGLLAIATVRMFETGGKGIVDPDTTTQTDADSAISFLLGLLFAAELGTRLFSVVAFQHQLKLAGNLMPQNARDLFVRISEPTKEGEGKQPISTVGVDFKEPNVAAFLSALYNTGGINSIKNETHLRWVLFDLTVFYHVIIRAYVLANQEEMTEMSIFTSVFSRSYMHFFVIMMMFSTTESIHQIYHIDHISDLIKVPSKHMFDCIKLLLKYPDSDTKPLLYEKFESLRFSKIEARKSNQKKPSSNWFRIRAVSAHSV